MIAGALRIFVNMIAAGDLKFQLIIVVIVVSRLQDQFFAVSISFFPMLDDHHGEAE